MNNKNVMPIIFAKNKIQTATFPAPILLALTKVFFKENEYLRICFLKT